MKKFKKIDFWLSIFIIIFCIIIIIATNDYDEFSILFACLIIGFWHVISMIVHLFNSKNWLWPIIRITYTALSIAAIYNYCSISISEYQFVFMLPIMAVCYTIFCGFETFYIKKSSHEKI